MSGDTLELFPRCRFKFTNLVAGNSLVVPMVRALGIDEFGDATLVVRVHAANIEGGSTVTITVRSTSPSADDPGVDFVDPDPVATVVLDLSASAGDLEVAPLTPSTGSHVQVTVTGARASNEAVDVTLSAELVVRENAPAARLTSVAPANVTRATASAGTSLEVARADHKHDITTATAATLTDSTNAEGSATSLARSDHTHSHGTRGGGTLHAVATTSTAGFMSAADKTKLDALPMTPTAVTATTSATTSPALYLCSPSSSTIDIDLPAASGNSGLRIGVKMVDSNGTTRTARLDPSGAETIDGQTTVTLYVDGDYLEVECDGSTWHVVVDGRIAHRSNMRNASTQSISNNTVTQVDFSAAGTDVDVGGLADTTNNEFDIKRSGSYIVSGSINLPNIDDQERITLRIRVNGTGQNYIDMWASGNDREMAVSLTALLELSAGDAVTLHVYHNEGASQSTSSTLEDQPRFSVAEIMPTHVP
jgi:hypothetical protein